MSEVHRYKVVKMLSEGGNKLTYSPHGPYIVMAEAFDAERALRLKAERQVGELRRVIAERSALHQICIRLLGQSKANLNPSGNLAKEIRKVLDTDHKLNRILNNTSTEGKDHE